MIIRDARAADLPVIVEIYNAAIPTRLSTAQLEPVTIEERQRWFDDHSPTHHPIWVAEAGRTIAGWLSFQSFIKRSAYAGTAEISIYVTESARRRSVGHRLLAEAIRCSPSLTLTALIGCIFAHNTPSLELFARAAFERWGLLPRVARLDGVERDLVIVGRHV